eukprot:31292-Pelagococcus_subviridis.AAC.10
MAASKAYVNASSTPRNAVVTAVSEPSSSPPLTFTPRDSASRVMPVLTSRAHSAAAARAASVGSNHAFSSVARSASAVAASAAGGGVEGGGAARTTGGAECATWTSRGADEDDRDGLPPGGSTRVAPSFFAPAVAVAVAPPPPPPSEALAAAAAARSFSLSFTIAAARSNALALSRMTAAHFSRPPGRSARILYSMSPATTTNSL